MLLKNEEFLNELANMCKATKKKGAVRITIKRYDGSTKPKPRDHKTKPVPEPEEYKCLLRVKIQSKKISTVVRSKDVDEFHEAYSKVLEANFDGLKKPKATQ